MHHPLRKLSSTITQNTRHSTFVQKPADERFLGLGFLRVRVQEELSLDLRRGEDSASVFDPGTLGGLGGRGGDGDDGGD